MLGSTISHYQLQKKLGAGGMGEVYLAHDTSLNRLVALKILPAEFVSNQDRMHRFTREAKAASAISHPNVAHIYEIGEENNIHFIAMEYVEGETLTTRMQRSPLGMDEVLQLAIQIADALQEAHGKGIIHRDIKPANIILTPRGKAKLVDFGLAKIYQQEESIASRVSTTSQTEMGVAMGTLPYMSPEQLLGRSIDQRTDLFSVGVLLYELLTQKLPFQGRSSIELADAILNKPPAEMQEVPSRLQPVISRLLAKDPAARYQHAGDLLAELQKLQTVRTTSFSSLLRPVVLVPLIVVLCVASFLLFRTVQQNKKIRWAREVALLKITELIDEGKNDEALDLALQAEKLIPNDPLLKSLWHGMSIKISIQTEPAGANVFFKKYDSPADPWILLGTSPLQDKRIAKNYVRLKIQKEGYPEILALSPRTFFENEVILRFNLEDYKKVPLGMTLVPGVRSDPSTQRASDSIPIEDDYYMDQFEVTNQEFKKFVDAGGYSNRKFWKIPFVKEGKDFTFEEAMSLFVDATGRPGPLDWEVGNFPAGQEKFPVTGVSWYEGAAYGEFAGKALPTIFHWFHASGTRINHVMIPFSNFRSRGPHPAGKQESMSLYGSFDMAGNVKEWSWTEVADGRRVNIGGSYLEPEYLFLEPDRRDPFTRHKTIGFRCIQYLKEPPAALLGRYHTDFRDYTKEKPVEDSTYAVLKTFYSYDKKPLNARVESKEQLSYLSKEKVSFSAAYGNERVIAYIFLPTNAKPPYQTVLYFPGSWAQFFDSSERLGQMGEHLDFLVRSGRAVVHPVYAGTLERGGRPDADSRSTEELREWRIKYIKDVSRTIDYLETRADMNSQKIAYFGYSWGARVGAIVGAVEPRIRTLILAHGGLPMSPRAPETDEINFITRVDVPVLMINGRYDHVFPVDTSQKPFFQLLGTPENEKVHMVFEGGHSNPRSEVKKIMLDWLDRYLGRV
ncbi:protein kinase [bacterium]|nr:protein kinase [bacterium]